jgi:hypothetical protein
MIETIFSPPHNATEDECRRMWVFYSLGKSLEEMIRDAESQPHDVRWSSIYSLYHLRGDQPGMAHALSQIKDRQWADELTYRDVFTTEELERMK